MAKTGAERMAAWRGRVRDRLHAAGDAVAAIEARDAAQAALARCHAELAAMRSTVEAAQRLAEMVSDIRDDAGLNRAKRQAERVAGMLR